MGEVITPEIVKNGAIEVKPDNQIIDVKSEQDKTPGKTVVIEKPLSLKHSLFCEYIVKHGMLPLDAYCKVYSNSNRSSSSAQCSRLLDKPKIQQELTRLRNANCTNYQETINNLHGKAVETLEKLIETSDKDSVKLGAVREVINRTVPIINKSMHVGVKVNRTELDRRSNALSE